METKRTEFITSENEHWYQSPKKKGVYYPSVTTILSIFPKGVGFNRYLAAQTSWEDAEVKLKEAGEQGTRVHKATEALELGEKLFRDNFTLREWKMLIGFVNWYREYNPKKIHIELGVVSDKQKTGGTIDRVYDIDGELVVLDIKTSNAIYENYWCQTAAYATMLEELYKLHIHKTAILRVTDQKKDGYECRLRDRDGWREDFKVFKALQAIWNYLNPNAQPKIEEVQSELTLI